MSKNIKDNTNSNQIVKTDQLDRQKTTNKQVTRFDFENSHCLKHIETRPGLQRQVEGVSDEEADRSEVAVGTMGS